MEFKVYGHDGKPCLVFPPQDGKFTDYENFKMVETLSDYIEQGKLRLFCVDSVDRESQDTGLKCRKNGLTTLQMK